MLRLVAVDAGTTSVRALATDLTGAVVDVAQRELTAVVPRSRDGSSTTPTRSSASSTRRSRSSRSASTRPATTSRPSASPTSARRPSPIDRADGRVLAPAIVWQDRRTAAACAALAADGRGAIVRARTGLTCRPVLLCDQDALAARQRRARRRPRPRPVHDRHARLLAPHRRARRAGSSRPTRRTRRAPCSTTSTRERGATSCAALFGVPTARPRRAASVVQRPRARARGPHRGSRRRGRSPASSATSRRRSSASAAPRRGW